jgi:hypothetical protein
MAEVPVLRYLTAFSALLLLLTSQLKAQRLQEWTAPTRAMWETGQKRQTEAFAAMLASDYVGVYGDGIHSRAAELQTLSQINLRSFRLSDLVARPLVGETELVTYKVTVTGDFAGTDFSGAQWVASIWRKRGGKWQLVLYSEARSP